MHYYSFNLGDWALHTSHLSLEEEAVYRRLLDFYYDTESPIPEDTAPVVRRLRLGDHSDLLPQILSEFFTLEPDGWHNKRADIEIEKYHLNIAAKSRAGKASADAKKKIKKNNSTHVEQPLNSVATKSTSCSTNQEPRTNNQEPETINQEPVKSKTLSDKPDPVLEIFGYWQDVMGRPQSKLTPKRKKAISGRLKEGYTVDEIRAAIVGCSNDPWSMGQNDRQKAYNDIELICRTGAKLEWFAEARPAYSELGKHVQRTINNIADVELT